MLSPFLIIILLVPHNLKRPSQNSGQSVQTLFPLQRLRSKSVWPVRIVCVLGRGGGGGFVNKPEIVFYAHVSVQSVSIDC